MANSESVVGTFVRTVLHKVYQQGVNYVVLRNYEGLPDRVGHDIDVLVGSDQLHSFGSILLSTAHEQGWYLVRTYRYYGLLKYIFAFVSPSQPVQLLEWDLWTLILWKGIVWIDCALVFRHKRIFNEFFIPSPGSEAAMLCLKDAIHVGIIRRKYCHRIWELSKQDPRGFQTALEKYWGEETVHWLLDHVQQHQWEDIERAIPRLRKMFVVRALCMSPVETVKGVFRFLLSHLRARPQTNRGYFLCFIGPDGSGKSTISRKTSTFLSGVFKGVQYYHGRFGILPELKTYVRWWRGRKGVSRNISLAAKSGTLGRLRSFLHLLYYCLDYFLGHLSIARARGRGDIVVFDRYFYDYVIQPGPFSADSFLFRILFTLIPSPDAVIYLQAPPATVHARKPELSFEEIARQSRVCEKLINCLPNAYTVDNTLPADEVTARVCDIVLRQMSKLATHGAEISTARSASKR